MAARDFKLHCADSVSKKDIVVIKTQIVYIKRKVVSRPNSHCTANNKYSDSLKIVTEVRNIFTLHRITTELETQKVISNLF